MKKILISIICCIMCISTMQGMKRLLPVNKIFSNNVSNTVKTTKSLIPLTSEQRIKQARLVEHDVLLDDIQNNIALHMIVDFLLLPKTINAHISTIYGVAIDNDKIITGSADRTAKIWDIHTHELLHLLAGPDGHTDEIWAVAIYNDKAVTASRDRTAKIWNNKTGKLLHTLQGPNGHTSAISSIKINGDKVITGAFDNTAKIWNMNTGQLLHTLKEPYEHINIVYCVATYDNLVATASYDHTTKIWDINTGKHIHTLGGEDTHTAPVTSIVIINDNVITSAQDGIIKIWNKYTGQFLYNLPGPKGHTDMLACNQTVVTSSYNESTIKLWNIHTRKSSGILAGPYKHMDGVPSVAIDTKYVVTGSYDHTVKIWPLQLDLNTEEFTQPEHPLFWIKHYILPYQAHLIARAHAAQKLIISSKSNDAYTWVTFPAHVREYLQKHLNITLKK